MTVTQDVCVDVRAVPARREHLRYRPYLDGLRAVAVYLVVAFHSGLHGFAGGFVGVDIFFVLSGFLVTSILVRDLSSRDRIDWRRFYSRRSRRILPAAVVTLLITALLYAAIASPAEMQDALGGFRSAFLYVANWHFIQQSTDYFAANVNTNPVLHFWSLAVEEQFYLLWPLLLGALYFVSRIAGARRWWLIRIAVGAIALASLAEALHLASTNLDRAYYGTDARAYQLLAGALLALTPQLLRFGARHRRAFARVALVALVGLVAVGTSALSIGPISRGVIVAGLAVVLILALENADGGAARGFLSTEPVIYLGRISYGTYLWHWPVIVLLTRNSNLDPVLVFIVATLLATSLATVSFFVLEMPIRTARNLDRFKTPIIATGLAISAIAGLVITPLILDRGTGTVAGASISTGQATSKALLDWRVAKADVPALPDCLHHAVEACEVVHGSGARVVLIGDSTARMWIPAFTAIAKREHWTFAVTSYIGCPWEHHLEYAGGAKTRALCAQRKDDWYSRVIPEFKPDMILLSHGPYDDPARPNKFILPDHRTIIGPTSPDWEHDIQAADADSLRALAPDTRKIVIIDGTPVPGPKFDPIICLSKGTPAQDCSYTANHTATPLERYYKSLTSPSLATLDLDRVVCPRLPTCDAIVDNIIVKRDFMHITATYSASRANQIDHMLHVDGIIGAGGKP